jgi:predicted nuclease of predicted toxin-antitoxin system
MPFPLYADEAVSGQLVKMLLERGWDVVRAVDVFPAGTTDEEQLEYAARENRVFIGVDEVFLQIGRRWHREGGRFRMILWSRENHRKLTISGFVRALGSLAKREDAFDYPIVRIKVW